MRCAVSLAALTLFLSLGNAFSFPQETPWTANQVDDWGWTPKPTAVPEVLGRSSRYGLRRDLSSSDAGLETVCGYEGTQPFTCGAYSSTTYYCETASSALDCCPLGVNGTIEDCAITTACYNSAQSAKLCAANGCNAATGVWYVFYPAGSSKSLTQPNNSTDTQWPECVTFQLGTYSSFWCDSSAAVVALSLFPFTPSSSLAVLSPTPPLITDTPISSVISLSTSSSVGVASLTSSAPIPTQTVSSPSHVGEIVGGVVGGVAGIALIAAIIGFIIYRVRRKRAEASYDDAPEMSGATYNIK